MAITEQEKQDIIRELMSIIRSEGLEYGGNPITFNDPFNITQTERQNVKIPAIDERKSTVVHGNVDLESLLQAYGLTEVQQIASDISTKYMKKVADSDLNMKGYDIEEVSSIRSQSRTYSEGFYAYMPRITLSHLGNPSSASAVFSAYLKKVAELYPNEARFRFEGILEFNGQGTITGYIYSSSSLGSNGVPTYSSFFFKPSQAGMAYIGHTTYGGALILESISTFPYGNTTKDNRINAMGNTYIRWENGLQICWSSPSSRSATFNAWGNVYSSTIVLNSAFDLPFLPNGMTLIPIISNDAWCINQTLAEDTNSGAVTGISAITVATATNALTRVRIGYVAIGRWK